MALLTPTVVENGVPEAFCVRTTEVMVSPAFAEAKRLIVGLLRQESLEAQRQEAA